MARNQIYEDAGPHQAGELQVVGGHTLYWEQRGNASGVPVILLHGGPGSKPNPIVYRTFNPNVHRIVSLDQRGCGRSQPLGSVDENNLDRLVDDVDTLRQHLEIDKWIVCGGSWGSTLGLAYGGRYPGSCLGFLLRSIFLCAKGEVHWWLYGMRSVFPEYWDWFAELVPAQERDDLVAAYGRLLSDSATALEAARRWKTYERACSTLVPSPQTENGHAPSTIATARIHNHYFANNFFTDETKLLSGVERMRHLPVSIIHGRYDMICPVANAVDLAAHWGNPGAELTIVEAAGHSIREPGILSAAIAAAERLTQRI